MVLEIKKISKNFGGIQALNDVSFSVKQGEVLGLIGPNGAGKTTMFNMITAMYPPSAGEIIFDGKPLKDLKPHEITKMGICRTFQNIRLFADLTVRENVMVGNHCRLTTNVLQSVFKTKFQRQEEKQVLETSDEILEIVGLADDMHTIAKNLSYGQQRRLEIARALASKPKLILLDEPAAGMNEKETNDLFDLIKKIQSLNITVLLIEHDMPLVMRICDRLIVLNFGGKIAEGSPQSIQNNKEVIEAYLGVEEEEEELA